jgi:KDO2-lipid IV(A) lauroyltransferase
MFVANFAKVMIKKAFSGVLIFFLYLMSLLPFWILYLLADFIYLVLYYLTGYRRAVVQLNLRNSFPNKASAELKAIEKQYYKYLGDLTVETIKMITISEKEVRRRMLPTNPEVVESYYRQGRSIIGAVGHYGNWELAALGFSLIPNYHKVIVYKPLSNKKADEFYQRVRGRFGAILVSMKGTLRKLVELKKQLTFTVLVSDQTPVRHETQYYTTFLNQQTAVFLGVEKTAKMLNSVVIFGDVQRVKRGFYQYTIVPLTENAAATADHQITDLHVQYLEKMIKREPAFWLWSHRRWKFNPEEMFQ